MTTTSKSKKKLASESFPDFVPAPTAEGDAVAMFITKSKRRTSAKEDLKAAVLDKLQEFNQNHDKLGRFATSANPGISMPNHPGSVRYKMKPKTELTLSEKRSRAGKLAQKYKMSPEKRARADKWQAHVAEALGGESTKDSHPVDIITKGAVIEVKTLLSSKNDKVTSHKSKNDHNINQVRRKKKFSKETKKPLCMIAVDARADKPIYYFRNAVGSFRLKNMEQYRTVTGLINRLKGLGYA